MLKHTKKNGIHAIIVYNETNKLVTWLKMHDTQAKLSVKNMFNLTINKINGIFNSRNHTKQQIEEYEIGADDGFNFICEELDLKIIMNYSLPTAVEFKTKLGFNQCDLIMKKEESVLTKIIKIFATSFLGCKIHLYFPEHIFTIEVDEKGHKSRR